MSTNISRRNFLRLSALGGTAMLLPSGANALESPLFAPAKDKKGSANDIINLGFIGLGQQAIHLMNGFIIMAMESRLTFQKAIKPKGRIITEAIAKVAHKEHRG